MELEGGRSNTHLNHHLDSLVDIGMQKFNSCIPLTHRLWMCNQLAFVAKLRLTIVILSLECTPTIINARPGLKKISPPSPTKKATIVDVISLHLQP